MTDPRTPTGAPGASGPTPLPVAHAAERRHLRRFGLTVGIAFFILTAFLLWKDRPAWPYTAGAGGLLMVLGLVVPAVLRPVERIWMKAAGYMGWFMTRVILGIVFLLVFTPAGLIMRVLRKDPMKLRVDPQAPSYWEPRTDQDHSPERMERMF